MSKKNDIRIYRNVLSDEYAIATQTDNDTYRVELDNGRKFYCAICDIMHPFNLGAGWVKVRRG